MSSSVITGFIPRADHVGSLLRPERLIDALEKHTSFRFDKPRPIDASLEFGQHDQDALREITDECIREAVARQAEIGLDCVTDGEFRRVFFRGSLDQAVKGFAPNPAARAVLFHNNEKALEIERRPIVAGHLEVVAYPGADEARFVSSITDRLVKVTFPAASSAVTPVMWHAGVTDQYYENMEALAAHATKIVRGQIDAAIEAGATYIQLDYPPYLTYLDESVAAAMSAQNIDVQAMIQAALDADRKLVEGLPDHVRLGLHLCRGNLRGMWNVDAELNAVAEQIFNLPYHSFLIEWSDTNRMGDYSPLRHVPKGKVVSMGIVDSKTAQLEDEESVIAQLEDAARFVELEQLSLCPQCGFASEAGGNPLSEDQQWAKLALVRRVADRVWGS